MKKNQQKAIPWKMAPWFMDSCHFRHFLPWQTRNVAPDEGSGYNSLWICFLPLLLSHASAFTLHSCSYPIPGRSEFCPLRLMHIRPSFTLPVEPLQHLTSGSSYTGASERKHSAPQGCGGNSEHPGLTLAPRNSDTGCLKHPASLFPISPVSTEHERKMVLTLRHLDTVS